MGRFLLLLFPLLTIMVAVTGCEDDDCPVCPRETVSQVLISGEISFIEDERLYLTGEAVSASGNLMPELDSVQIWGYNAALTKEYFYGIPSISISLYFVPNLTESGDTINVVAFTPYGRDTCRIVLIDQESDTTYYYDWESEWPYDTVETNTELEVSWKPVSNADGYRVRVEHLYDPSGPVSTYQFITDTSVTIGADENVYDGWYVFDVRAVNGVCPDGSTDNISGSGAVKWELCSWTYTEYLRIYVGTGAPVYVIPGGEGGTQ